MMHAKQRLYLTAERDALVPAGDERAAILFAIEGDEIPDSAAEKFGLVDGELPKSKPGKLAEHETLLGSSVLPALVEIAPGKSVQLGTIVGRAYKASGLTLDAWNALDEADREARLAQMVETMKKAEASRAAGAKPPGGKKEQKPASDKEQKPSETKDAAAGGDQPPVA